MAWDPSHSPAVTTPLVVSRLKLIPGLTLTLLSCSAKPSISRGRGRAKRSSPVVLRLRCTQLAYFGRLAGVSACRGVVVAGLAADVLLEHGVVALEKSGDVVPERRRKLGRGIGDTKETAVGVLD